MFLPESHEVAIVRPVVPPAKEGSGQGTSPQQKKPIERGPCANISPVRINMEAPRDLAMERAVQESDAVDVKNYKPLDILCMQIQRPTAIYTGPALRQLMTGGLDEGDTVQATGWMETFRLDRDGKPVNETVRVLGPIVLVEDPATGKQIEVVVSYNAFAPKPEDINDPAYDAALAKKQISANPARNKAETDSQQRR